jgi:hypothetical protein
MPAWRSYIVLPMVTRTSQAEAYQKARAAAVKALALDDSLAEAHLSIAEVSSTRIGTLLERKRSSRRRSI